MDQLSQGVKTFLFELLRKFPQPVVACVSRRHLPYSNDMARMASNKLLRTTCIVTLRILVPWPLVSLAPLCNEIVGVLLVSYKTTLKAPNFNLGPGQLGKLFRFLVKGRCNEPSIEYNVLSIVVNSNGHPFGSKDPEWPFS